MLKSSPLMRLKQRKRRTNGLWQPKAADLQSPTEGMSFQVPDEPSDATRLAPPISWWHALTSTKIRKR
jgi:hypothetical protein